MSLLASAPLGAPAWAQGLLLMSPALFPALLLSPPMFVCAWLAMRHTRKLTPTSHWTERARLWWPGILFLNVGTFLCAVFGLGLGYVTHGPLSTLPLFAHMMLSVVSGLLGAQLASYAALRLRRAPSITSGRIPWLGAYLRRVWTQVLFMPQMLLVLSLIAALPLKQWRWQESAVWVAFAALFVVMQVMSPSRRLGLVGAAQQAPPRLLVLAREACARQGLAPADIWIAELGFANAFAFTITQEIVVTRPMLETLDEEELASVLDHEVAHLTEPRGVHLTRLVAAVIAPLGLSLVVLLLVQRQWVVSVVSLVVFLAVLLVIGRMTRRMEERADEHGAAHHGEVVYARALEKIYEYNLTPATTGSKRSAHPDLYDRMCDAGAPPDYPRPEPPPAALLERVLFITFALVVALAVVFPAPPETKEDAWWRTARTGGSVATVLDLANVHDLSRDREAIQAQLAWVASREEPLTPYDAMRVAWLYHNIGDCEAAVTFHRERVRPVLAGAERLSRFDKRVAKDLDALLEGCRVNRVE